MGRLPIVLRADPVRVLDRTLTSNAQFDRGLGPGIADRFETSTGLAPVYLERLRFDHHEWLSHHRFEFCARDQDKSIQRTPLSSMRFPRSAQIVSSLGSVHVHIKFLTDLYHCVFSSLNTV